MGTLPEENGCWLDTSVAGIEIREDVRQAAAAVWLIACKKTRVVMGDDAETAALMEMAAAQTSRYLDGLGDRASTANTRAVLLHVFRCLLQRRAMPLRRFESLGRDIEIKAYAPSWEDEVNLMLIFEKLQRHLSPDSVTIFSARWQGYTWEEIAVAFQTTVTAVKKRFWRDIEDAKVTLGIEPTKKPAGSGKVRAKKRGAAS